MCVCAIIIRHKKKVRKLTSRKIDLNRERIVPKSLGIRLECRTCDVIQGIHNQIWACGICNSSKGTKGLYEFYRIDIGMPSRAFPVTPPGIRVRTTAVRLVKLFPVLPMMKAPKN